MKKLIKPVFLCSFTFVFALLYSVSYADDNHHFVVKDTPHFVVKDTKECLDLLHQARDVLETCYSAFGISEFCRAMFKDLLRPCADNNGSSSDRS